MFFLAFGGMVGSGWLFAAPAAAMYAGPAAIFSWIITGFIAICILLVFTEMGSIVPKSGALVRLPGYTYGAHTSFFVGWLYFLSALVTPAVEGLAVASYVSAYVPGMWYGSVLSGEGIAIAGAFVFLMFLVNYFGVRLLGAVNSGIGWWKLIIPVLTFIFLLVFALHSPNLGVSGSSISFAPMGLKGVFYAIPAAGIIWAVEGFRQPIEFSGETKISGRSLMKVSILAFVFVIGLYVLLQIAFLGAVNWTKVGISPGNWIGLQNTGYYATPYFTALKLSGVPLLGAFSSFLLVDAWVSPTGTGWVYFGNTVRDLFGFGALGYFPKAFLKLNRYKVPLYGLIVTFVASILFYLPFPSWYAIISFAGVTALLAYVLGGPMVIAFRKFVPALKEHATVPYIGVVALIAWLGGVLIIYWAGFTTVWTVFSFGFVVLPLIYFTILASSKVVKKRVHSYILGLLLFVISLGLTIFGYYYIIAPPSSQTTTATLQYFLIFIIAFAITVYSITWITSRVADPSARRTINSFYWLLTLVFELLVVSFFGAFGKVTVIPFPWDTVLIMVISIPVYYWAIRSSYETAYLREFKRQYAAERETNAQLAAKR